MRRSIASGLADRARHAVEPLRGDGRGWALMAVAAGWLLILGTRITIPVLLPGIKATFAIDNATAGFAVSVVWGVYGLAQFPAGLLGDRVGDRAVLIAGLALMAASVVALGAAPGFGLFLLAAALVGVGNALFGPTRGTILSSIFPEHDSTAIALTLAVGSIGAAGLPFLAGVVVGRLGWRLTIASAGPLFLLAAAAAWWVIPPVDVGGSAGIGRGSAREGARRLAAAVSRRPVVLGIGGKSIRVFVYQGLTAFFPTYLIAVKDVGEPVAAGLLSLLFASGAVAQVAAGRLAEGYGDRNVLVAFAGAGALPLFALPFVSGLVPIVALGALMGIQFGVTPVTNAYVIDALPAADRGGSWGLLRAVYFLIASTGSFVVGVLGDAGLFDAAFLFLGALLLVAAGVFAFLPPRGAFG